MKSILIIIISLLSNATYANNLGSISKNEDIIFSQVVIFQEFHDPGWLLSTDGKEYYFYYEGFTFNNIDTWEQGRKLILTYSNKVGTQLYDPESGAVTRPVLNGEHIIERISDACIAEDGSTMGIASCYNEEYMLWDAMMNRIYQELKVNSTPKIFKSIQKMQRSWLTYRDNRFEVGRLIHANDTGTVTIIESSARAVSPVKQQALFLRSLLGY